MRAGHTGVSLFFVPSAFLLSLPFLREPFGSSQLSLLHDAHRRVRRIVPRYWTAVVVGTVIGGARLLAFNVVDLPLDAGIVSASMAA